ncbi:PGAP1-like alpha/beta domain-containing protein [Streptomyces lincolnensis]|uniref:PGAP1-like alpha/beta domain-containing protein n=1 Tax=Streptomyces lincolnensis TaxID=1915 RepID=UPI0037D69465
MGDLTRMVGYADVLHERPAAIAADACGAARALEALVSDAVEGGLSSAQALGEVGSDGREFALALTISMAARAAASPPMTTVAVRPESGAVAELLPLPGPLRRFLLRQLLRNFIPDANGYFFVPKIGDAIRDRLRAALDATDGPVVVVGHSLGTVVAYDVLSEDRYEDREIPLFVTLGSPLGYTEIQDVLVGRPLRVPAPVRLWTNFADPFDVVTLDTTLADDFRSMANVITDVPVDNRSPNSHAPCGYLRTREVRATVAAAV